MVLSKTHHRFKPKEELYSCDPLLPVDSVNAVDDDNFDLDLFKGHGHDRAVVEFNSQLRGSLSTESTETAYLVYSAAKPVDSFNPVPGPFTATGRFEDKFVENVPQQSSALIASTDKEQNSMEDCKFFKPQPSFKFCLH